MEDLCLGADKICVQMNKHFTKENICNVCFLSEKPFRFNFAILVAGFRSRSADHQALYSQPIRLPTLHVYGDTDKVIPKGS